MSVKRLKTFRLGRSTWFDAERDGHGGVRWKRRPKNGIKDCRDRGWVSRTLLSLSEIARGMNVLRIYHHVYIYGLNH